MKHPRAPNRATRSSAWTCLAYVASGLALVCVAPACSWVVGWDGLGGGCRGSRCDGDAGSPSEAGAGDSSSAVDGAAVRLCDSPHTLCDDFEHGSFPDLSRWTTLERSGGATAGSVADDRHPGTQRYGVELPEGSAPSAMLIKALSSSPARIVCDFDFSADVASARKTPFTNFIIQLHPTDASLDDYSLEWTTAPEPYAFTEFWRPHGASFDGSSFPDVPQAVSGTWLHVRMELAAAPRPSVQWFYNGGSVGIANLSHFPSSYDVVRLKFGAATGPDDVGGRAAFDNIVCDATP